MQMNHILFVQYIFVSSLDSNAYIYVYMICFGILSPTWIVLKSEVQLGTGTMEVLY